ncbi:DUF4230 domain-containing protein [Luteolibacter sp. GHJ8]|uniref:DUF4230 domain-containing protein n=1 Tax=Luteolibacter rhizosphaerae TaxID=2989719 RepID=A0ABT3GAF6_9BACT|nr:DUF4230 domain-containing protein [Luteolibacter rhizosphaerae]MCW1916770.1 DUF4230 domain-containing protein [Luteolibacter rhizosphaerae]
MNSQTEMWKTVRWASVILALLALAWLGLRVFERGMGNTVNGLEKVLGAITSSNTRIVEGRAEISQTSQISELALVEMKMSATRSFENESYVLKYLPAGTKKLIIRGEYRVTAGYKLEPGVSLRMENGMPVARFPDPEILSVELLDFQQLSEKDGWMNQITSQDREQLIKELNIQMRQEARRSGVLEIVESSLHTRLRDLLGAGEVKVERAPKEKGNPPSH